MKKIEINIPDDLSPEKEIIAIAQKLQQKQLSGSAKNKSVLRIGDNIDIKEIQTQIIINRVSTEIPIIMIPCNVCNCEYDSKKSKYYYQNYGGAVRRNSCCSDECRNVVLNNFPSRTSLKKSKIKPAFLWR